MQFRHLRYFVSVVEAGSFSRAAAAIHVAQPALSQQVAELEERLGQTLLKRSSRGVRPTAAGDALYRKASAILRQLERLPELVRSSSGETQGTVSLGIATSLAGQLVGPFIEACKVAHPKVTLKWFDGDSASLGGRVEANSLDIAVLFEGELASPLSRRPLFRQRLYFVGKDRIVEQGELGIARTNRGASPGPAEPSQPEAQDDRACICLRWTVAQCSGRGRHDPERALCRPRGPRQHDPQHGRRLELPQRRLRKAAHRGAAAIHDVLDDFVGGLSSHACGRSREERTRRVHR